MVLKQADYDYEIVYKPGIANKNLKLFSFQSKFQPNNHDVTISYQIKYEISIANDYFKQNRKRKHLISISSDIEIITKTWQQTETCHKRPWPSLCHNRNTNETVSKNQYFRDSEKNLPNSLKHSILAPNRKIGSQYPHAVFPTKCMLGVPIEG